MRQESSPEHDAGVVEPARIVAACNQAAAAAAAASDPAAAVDSALELLYDEIGAYAAALILEHGRLWVVQVRGYPMIPDGLELDQGIVGRAVRLAQPQLVLDVREDPDFVEAARGVVSELAVPLRTADGIVGALNLETPSRLPPNADRLLGPLPAALAPHVDALRGVRTLDLPVLTRYFVFVGSLRDPVTIAEATTRVLGRGLPFETCQLALVTDDELRDAASWRASDDAPAPLDARELEALRARVGPSIVFELLDTAVTPLPELTRRIRSVAVMPLRANGKELGVVVALGRAAPVYDQSQAESAALVAAHAAASIDAAIALSRERRSALTDPLTGLLNRRGFEEVLETELTRAQEQRLPLSVVVLDCDDLKEINDRAGHEFGDALLREVGVVLPSIAAAGARAARLGGDEFVVMLPGADADAGERVAEQLRESLVTGLAEAGFPFRASMGVSAYPFDGGGASQLMRAADQALYDAKAAGKNRIVGYRELVRRGSSALGHSPETMHDRRPHQRSSVSTLPEVGEAADAIWSETSVEGVLARLAKVVTFVVGATGCAVSRVEGPRLTDIARHSMRDIDLGAELAYLIEDFPVTQEVLTSGAARALSFLDADLDRAEAFVLRELRMNCCLLLPLPVRGRPWGLVEAYDMRLRRFTNDELAAADFIVRQAGRRIEALGDVAVQKRKLPLFRVPSPE